MTNSIEIIQIELVPFFALALILHLSIKEFPLVRNVRRFRFMVIYVMSILAVDGINWHTIIHPQEFSNEFVWIINILYFLLTETISFAWFQYVYHQIHEDNLTAKQKTIANLSVIPLVIIFVIILTSPWNHMIFYIDPADNHYYRGDFHILQTLFGFGYMLAASIFALFSVRDAPLTEQKKEYRFLAGIIVLPLVGGILQILNFDLVFLWPFTAASAFLIYVDFQKHQISVDALTSLNNRGSLERYLLKKEHGHEYGWYMIMMDIDKFKSINDKYGHMEGDRVLKIVAQSLTGVFEKYDAFIARFGGDEFTVVSYFDSPDVLITALGHCRSELYKQKMGKKLSYDISISAGYAKFDETEFGTVKELLREAEKKMYEEKERGRRI